jgi:uncharacterized membrane protein
MKATRLEAFSDGVLAIVITIMVLEMKVPHEPSFEALRAVWPEFLSYLLSFAILAIYWVNHHHLLHLVRAVDGPMLWANLLLLFCLSLFPFVTAHLGQSRAAPYATSAYVTVALASALAFYLLRYLIARHDRENLDRAAMHRHMRRKNRVAIAIYLTALVASYVSVPVALVLVVLPAAMYFLPEAQPAGDSRT